MLAHHRRLRVAAIVTLASWTACTDAGSAPVPAAAPPVLEAVAPPASPRPAPPDTPTPTPAPPFQRTRSLMGTIVSITVVAAPESQAAPAVDAAFAKIAALEEVLSEWRPDSEISRINAAAGGAPVKVGPDTMAVIKAGLEVSAWSDGAFDLSWAAMRGLYLFQPGEERIPTATEIKDRLRLVGYRDIVLDPKASTVALRRAGMKLGTGGIAKGYALDRAAEVLKLAGIENYMLFGGGQVQVSGRRDGRPWRVGIQHPRRDDYFAFVESTGGSISTSGDYEHAFVRDGRRWHHIIDLKTGYPVDHTSSVTLVADSGVYADALSTAVFVLGPKRALELLSTAPGATAGAVIIGSDMTFHASPDLRERLVVKIAPVNGKLPL
jgi:thiamine biosynthesis lipoprotein